ncbi:MAG TPA: hypothetical protein VNX21_09210 [Candidatus Thermoplasmatota archaeon]|nr:hypothetical protein [Candidatus Thermoplasmatota archaeon]
MRLTPLALAAVVLLAVAAAAQVAGGEAPAAYAGPDRRVECTSPAGATVALDGAGSRAADNDTLARHVWTEDGRVVAEGASAQVTLPLGRHELRLAVWNATQEVANDTVVIEVVDTTPPALAVLPSVGALAARGHRMVPVTFAVTATDACGPAGFVLASVASDEPADGRGDGRTAPDVEGADVGTPDTTMAFRAERAGPGDGRTYAATYRATDAGGNAAEATGVVLVPHG